MPSTQRWLRIATRLAVMMAPLVAGLPHRIEAAQFFNGSHLVVSRPDTLHDDLYAAGGSVVIRGVVDGDVVVAGGQVRVLAAVMGSVIAAGGDVQISGDVSGSVRAAGGKITVESNIARDLVASGGRLVIQNASIGRDAVIAGGRASVDGRIGRNVHAALRELSLGEHAAIAGHLDYFGDKPLVRSSGAVVSGGVTWQPRRAHLVRRLVGTVRWAIGLAIAGSLLLLFFPTFSRRTVETMAHRPLASLGVGLLAFVAVPLAAGCLFLVGVLIGGWWIGAAIGIAWLVTIAVGFVLAAMTLGASLLAGAGKARTRLFAGLLLSLFLFALVHWIPVLGRLLVLIAALPGVGALMINMGSAMKAARAPAPAM